MAIGPKEECIVAQFFVAQDVASASTVLQLRLMQCNGFQMVFWRMLELIRSSLWALCIQILLVVLCNQFQFH